MRVTISNIFILLAVVLFAVGGFIWLTSDAPDADTTWELLFFGLTFFAAGHLAV